MPDEIIPMQNEEENKSDSSHNSGLSANANEMENDVMSRHIGLYVNEFTLALGFVGREAVKKLLKHASDKGVIPEIPDRIFLFNG